MSSIPSIKQIVLLNFYNNMNILKARNQLHQIAQNNPQTDHFHFFQSNSTSPDPHHSNTWKGQRHPRILHSQHPQTHLYKDEAIKTITEKNNNQEKVQVKTPIFKNKKGENFSSSQKSRFEKLGLQNFLQQSIIDKRVLEKNQEPIEQKIIKNLNNTYFRSTQHIHGKRKNMVNSLGIKKSSMSNYKVDWDQKNIDELEIEWKYIGYIPNKVFPCRKNVSFKNKIYTPKKRQSPKKDMNLIADQTKVHDGRQMQKTSSARCLQSKDFTAKNSLQNLNEKFNALQSSRTIKNDKKVFINSSKIFNKSQQLVLKAQVSRAFTIERARPMSQKNRRPWTSKQTLMRNHKISEHLSNGEIASGKRRYSQSTNRSFHIFNESHKKQKTDCKNSMIKNIEIQDGSDFIKGKKIYIYQLPEQRIIEYF